MFLKRPDNEFVENVHPINSGKQYLQKGLKILMKIYLILVNFLKPETSIDQQK